MLYLVDRVTTYICVPSQQLCVVVFFFLMTRRPPKSTQSSSSAASDVYKRQTIDYGTNTPLASTIMYAGNPSETISPFKLKFEVYSDAGVVEDSFEIFKNKCSAGAFAFSYKGIRDDGLDEMPISFVGKCDNTRAANRQLMAWQKYV